MPTPPPDPEHYRHEVQNRVQSLLSGQRPRHPILSQYSTRRLILEGLLEEVRIYRLNKEKQVLKAREDAARMHERRGEGGQASSRRDGREKEQGESSHHGRRRDKLGEEDRQPLLGEDDQSSGFIMSGGASGPPLSDEAAAQPKHSFPGDPKKNHGHSRLHSPLPGSSQGKQRLDRHGKPLVRSKRGWRDATPGPFPEYKFKKGPMLGLGDHLRERFQWGVDSYHLQQRRKERRERGSLDERRKVRKGKGAEEDKKGREKEEKPMSKSEGKRPVEQDHSSHSPKGGPSGEARSTGRKEHARHVEKITGDKHAKQQERGRHRIRSQRREAHDSQAETARNVNAEADARSKGERRARHEAEASHSSTHRGTRGSKPQIPVYEQTPQSQRVEARERAQAKQSDVNEENSQRTVYLDRSTNEEPSQLADDARAPPHLGTTATTATKWWSDRSDTSSDDSRHDPCDNNDEQYFSDHFIEELRSRTGSVASDFTTPRSQGPTGGKHGHRQLSPVDELHREADQSLPEHKNSPALPSGRATSGSHPLPEISVHTPSDSGRSSVSQRIWAQKLASEVNEPDHDTDEAGRRKP
ncbi:hypothetical protein PMIN01_03478 [Paraphaeosphaeria minitans]|uniref:Uncharacterized protein n=1 Tax=Paraphaeosphaeria minitans TaxID=565426 RepID=A0A9P6GNG4_9PLEO|nr:hypothetical protein PMIN01_03478 [Paraphaeosphaeria minitans]